MRRGNGKIGYKVIGAESEQDAREALALMARADFSDVPTTGFAVYANPRLGRSFCLRRTKTLIVCEVCYTERREP